MKRFIMICVWFSTVSNPAFSQEAGKEQRQMNRYEIPAPLKNRVSVNLENVSLKQALAVVSEKGHFKLNYNRDRIPLDQCLSVKMDNVEAMTVLDEILDATGTALTYSDNGVIAIIPDNQQNRKGQIRGRVIDAATQTPLIGTNITVVGTTMGTTTDAQGNYILPDLFEGIYTVQFNYMGYKTKRSQDIRVIRGRVMRLDVELEQEVILLKELIVTPGHFSIMGKDPTIRQTLTRQDFQTATFGEDIYRAITRLPGISSTDFSAKFTIRGGENEEVLVLMNGLELYEPFHLKDLDGGALSIIDVKAIEGIDLLTGGFPAEYGDRMSGVLNMKLKKAPEGRKRTTLGISLMNARLMSEGTFDNDKGSWLVSARRGYLDLVLDLVGDKESPSPKYYDILGKVDYPLGKKHTLSAHVLHSSDDFTIDDIDIDVQTKYGNSYGWLTLKSFPYSRLFIQTVTSVGRMTHNRYAKKYFLPCGEDNIDYIINDDRHTDTLGFRQDWKLEVSERWLMKWGIDLKNLKASYDYTSTNTFRTFTTVDDFTERIDTVATVLDPSGRRFGAYFANSFRVASPLTAEIGLRYDYASYTGDKHLSPRLNLVYMAGKHTFLRAGWGYFYQSEGMHEIKVQDREDRFYPAELAKHWVAGFEHTFRNGFHFRVESYYKKLSNLRPDYRNWSHDLEILPEMYDRFKLNFNGATSKGVEFYFKYDRGGRFTWWASYALATVRDDIESLIYEDTEYTDGGGVYPGKRDQRHTFYLDLNYRPNGNWHYNISWQFHSGWPYTQEVIESETNPNGFTHYYYTYSNYYGARFPAFHRLDFRVNRYFDTSIGHLSLFLALMNVYNRGNLRNLQYSMLIDENGNANLIETKEYWFKLLPSIGVSLSLDH